MMSQTVMLPHMYQNPEAAVVAQYGTNSGHQLDSRKVQDEVRCLRPPRRRRGMARVASRADRGWRRSWRTSTRRCSRSSARCAPPWDRAARPRAGGRLAFTRPRPQIGHVEDMVVLDNLSDHLVGNVYVKFTREEDSLKALQVFNGRFYAGRQLAAELSPVTDFREARCRQFVDGTCKRGHFCNFMHVKKISESLKRDLMEEQPHAAESDSEDDDDDDDEDERKRHKRRKDRRRSRSRSGSRDRRRRRDRSRRSKSGDRKSRHRDHDKRKRSRSRDRARDRDRAHDSAGADDAGAA